MFVPSNDHEKKLYIASSISKQMRTEIWEKLWYKASCGISYNKLCAKTSSGAYKPNAQTVVPIRYMEKAMAGVPIADIRFLGGKIS